MLSISTVVLWFLAGFSWNFIPSEIRQIENFLSVYFLITMFLFPLFFNLLVSMLILSFFPDYYFNNNLVSMLEDYDQEKIGVAPFILFFTFIPLIGNLLSSLIIIIS